MSEFSDPECKLMSQRPPNLPPPDIDFAQFYDLHPEYDARRRSDSPERVQVQLEVAHFKIPYLLNQLNGVKIGSALEIGCATGELIANFPTIEGGIRMGIDISERNIEVAQKRFPNILFESGDFRRLNLPRFDFVILSDVLEHVMDDTRLLADAASLASGVLVNLPLECNWLNRNRAYGPADTSGHLRSYTLRQGLELFRSAGLEVKTWQRVWIHETAAAQLLRDLRAKQQGRAFAGGLLGSTVRKSIYGLAGALPPFGRRLFASNLFVLAAKP